MQFGDRPTLGTRGEGTTSYVVQTKGHLHGLSPGRSFPGAESRLCWLANLARRKSAGFVWTRRSQTAWISESDTAPPVTVSVSCDLESAGFWSNTISSGLSWPPVRSLNPMMDEIAEGMMASVSRSASR